jgi:hypothetical protein
MITAIIIGVVIGLILAAVIILKVDNGKRLR